MSRRGVERGDLEPRKAYYRLPLLRPPADGLRFLAMVRPALVAFLAR
jgi:hypothetical protein